MFIPTTPDEVRRRGWESLDIILVSGDTYTDNAYNGTAAIGHWLIDHGYRVGIIAQPDVSSGDDISRLGSPELFWSVSAGCVDSMVANYTPTRKFRKEDDFTPGGVNDRRPDRATIAYTNLIKKHCKGRPVFLAGIEASLRRIAHYDFWSDSVRRSVLFDSKADGIVYGMAELATLELADRIREGEPWTDVRGICTASKAVPEGYIDMPSFEDVRDDRDAFMRAYSIFRDNCDPVTAIGLTQRHGDRYLVQNPPQRSLTVSELDSLYESDFEDRVHPFYAKSGHVRAMDTVRNSVTTHRGCYGDCSFCAIAVHQGTKVVSRSEESILREVERIASRPGFNGVIQDVGGPTANMYGIECPRKLKSGRCRDRRCLGSRPCPHLPIDHSGQTDLLRRISEVPGVRHVFVNSGIRYDMIVADRTNGGEYLDRIVSHHVSGQMKVAPEHVSPGVLRLMGKPERKVLEEFRSMFADSVSGCGRDLYLTYYFMAAHPGCGEDDMRELARYCRDVLHIHPEQVQVFTPTPSTYSTAMYRTSRDLKGRDVPVERSVQRRQRQKEIVTGRRRDARGPRPGDQGLPVPLPGGGRTVHHPQGVHLPVGGLGQERPDPHTRLPGRLPR